MRPIVQTTANDLGSYTGFLNPFLRKGYNFVAFSELSGTGGEIVLRHDIDFDTGFALQMARQEAELGIKATYFFLLRSNFYNIFSPEDYNNVCRIRDLGHHVSLHFDPLIYDDFLAGLQREVAVFESYFDTPVDIISIHRPNEFFQQFDQPIGHIEHTYQSKYFKHVKYFSDSTGMWRFGHPLESVEFLSLQSLHVLIHPIWWMMNGASNVDKLRLYFGHRVNNLKTEFYNNCIPFRTIHESV